jgi:hypothetical protein
MTSLKNMFKNMIDGESQHDQSAREFSKRVGDAHEKQPFLSNVIKRKGNGRE